MEKLEIIQIDRTDANVDNSRYEAKIPYEVIDDYGNKAILYRKEVIGNLESLIEQKEVIENSLEEINNKINQIKKLESKEETIDTVASIK